MPDPIPSYKLPAKCREPGCEESTKTDKWTKIRAQRLGWFFPRDGKESGYCKQHVPEWVPEWRDRVAKSNK